MSMSPLVVKLQKALAGVGVVTGNTQGDVLIAAINRIKSSAGSNPIPVIAEPQPLGPLLAEDEAKAIAAVRAEVKPKAKAKK